MFSESTALASSKLRGDVAARLVLSPTGETVPLSPALLAPLPPWTRSISARIVPAGLHLGREIPKPGVIHAQIDLHVRNRRAGRNGTRGIDNATRIPASAPKPSLPSFSRCMRCQLMCSRSGCESVLSRKACDGVNITLPKDPRIHRQRAHVGRNGDDLRAARGQREADGIHASVSG